MKQGVLLLGHGSRREEANRGLLDLAKMVAEGLGSTVRPAFFQFGRPSLTEVVAGLVEEGAESIIIVPAFLFPGMHLENDIPGVIDKLQERYPEVEFSMTGSLGADPRLAEILIERVRSESGTPLPPAGEEIRDPEQITAKSRALIDQALGRDFFERNFRKDEGEVARRVVHAMGNPEVARLLRFHPKGVAAGIEAIRKGAAIFTDVRMVEAGISKPALELFGCRTVCMINDPAVRTAAKADGVTRAMTAVRHFRESLPGNMMVIGNAPTALTEVLRQAEEGLAPALIIGTPVGFVGAAEAKELLAGREVPFITLLGNQGGSTAAVATVNALLALAQGKPGL